MAAAILDRVPVDEITRRAKHARPDRAAMSVVFGLLFGLAWLVAKVFRVAWLCVASLYMAADEGWRQAMGTRRPGPDITALVAENARLREENTRLDIAGLGPENARLLAEVERLRAENARLS